MALPLDLTMSPFQKLVWTGDVLRTVDWLIPAFQTVAFNETLARAIEISPENEKLEVLRESVAAIYSPPYLAAMYLGRYTQVPHISEFAKRIKSDRSAHRGYARENARLWAQFFVEDRIVPPWMCSTRHTNVKQPWRTNAKTISIHRSSAVQTETRVKS